MTRRQLIEAISWDIAENMDIDNLIEGFANECMEERENYTLEELRTEYRERGLGS
jgi:hypothetical protein